MITFLNELPDNVVGIELTGEITRQQYDEVYPKVETLAQKQGQINYLVDMKTDFKNITAGVWFDDLKLALKHLSKWHKIAIITDEKIIDNLTEIFSFVFPGESKTFKHSEYDAAVAWVSS